MHSCAEFEAGVFFTCATSFFDVGGARHCGLKSRSSEPVFGDESVDLSHGSPMTYCFSFLVCCFHVCFGAFLQYVVCFFEESQAREGAVEREERRKDI